VDCLFGYTGRPFDAATGLQNNTARWYDPIVGRWLSEDPINSGPNLYEYCGNSPLLYVDPLGLFTAFGQNWVMPWSPNAGGFCDTMSAYGSAAATAASGIGYGAAGGAATGTAVGLGVGAAVGGIPTGGIGALPGAGIGGAAGLVGGTIGGGISGFITAWNTPPGTPNIVVAGQSAQQGLGIGVVSGVLGPLGTVPGPSVTPALVASNQAAATAIARQIAGEQLMADTLRARAAAAAAAGDCTSADLWGELAYLHEQNIAQLRVQLSALGW
jgi:RHS repeat-associated protein